MDDIDRARPTIGRFSPPAEGAIDAPQLMILMTNNGAGLASAFTDGRQDGGR
jgi:hypothetical protein